VNQDDTTNDDTLPASIQTEAIERTVDRFATWVQFGDAKAGGVLALLVLGTADLIGHAGRLVRAHELRSCWGAVATAFFWIALALAVGVVFEVSRALFPRVRAKTHSVYYFGSVAEYDSGAAYASKTMGLSADEVTQHMAAQAWELARIASRKFQRVRMAYWLVLAFLGAWALARCALALT
jgi:hypothetical protein